MTTPPPKKKPTPDNREDDIPHGASDLLKPSKRDRTVVTTHPEDTEEHEAPPWLDGAGEDSSEAIQRSLMTDPDATSEGLAFIEPPDEDPPSDHRETTKLAATDVEPTRKAVISASSMESLANGDGPVELEPDTVRSKPTIPFSKPKPPEQESFLPVEVDHEHQAVAERETQKLAASDVEPTRRAAVDSTDSLSTKAQSEDEPWIKPDPQRNKATVSYTESTRSGGESASPLPVTGGSGPISSRETRKLLASDIEPTRAVAIEGQSPADVDGAADESEEGDFEQTKPAIPSLDLPVAAEARRSRRRRRTAETSVLDEAQASSRPADDEGSISVEDIISKEPPHVRSKNVSADMGPPLDEPASIEVTLSRRDPTSPEPPLTSEPSVSSEPPISSESSVSAETAVSGETSVSSPPSASSAPSVSSSPSVSSVPLVSSSEPISPEPPFSPDPPFSAHESIASQMLVPIPDPIPSGQVGLLAPADPDSTGRLDGLPPFALTDRIKKVRLDPEQTNKIVKDSALSAAISDEDIGSSAQSPGDPIASTSSPYPASPSAPQASATAPDAHEGLSRGPSKDSRRRVSVVILLITNVLSMVLGVAIGGAAMMYGVTGRIEIDRFLEGRRTTELSIGSTESLNQLSPTPPSPALERETPLSFVPDELGLAIDTAPTSLEREATDLPDILLVPVGFRPGQHQTENFDDETLQTIASIITSSKQLRVELVGYTTPDDDVPSYRRSDLALQRAAEVLDKIRSHGPSRRRFSTRAAEDDEHLPASSFQDGMIRPVVLRVLSR